MNYLWWILIIYLCILLPMFRHRDTIRRKRKKLRKKGIIQMNAIIEKYKGKNCSIQSQGSFGVTGEITDISDNWIEITQKNGKRSVLNLDFVTYIEEIKKK